MGRVDPHRYQRIKGIFFRLLELELGEREAFLERECAGDRALRAEVERLLTEHRQLDGFLEGRVDLSAAFAERPSRPDRPPLPECVGGYRVRRVLGWGAMGVVYLAEQRNPARPVALKVLRQDCVEPAARRRFRREATLLARLRHPGVAQIHEAGVAQTDAGAQPYLAMEFVDGVSPWEFCEARGLSAAERIELACRICDAIQHAHERGVLHRDLKPDNVLVTADGQPKVLDFGVARLSELDGEASFRTRTGQILGTIAYMSPEQARGAELDPRSDQFSLGVLLYELLTGTLPFETRGDVVGDLVARGAGPDEVAPLCEKRPELARDLEVVVGKALAHEPARRYPSVADFAADLRRVLAGRPIQARPPSAIYRLRKLVQRHRALAAGVAGAFAVLFVALAFAMRTLDEVRASERRASHERDAVLRLSDLELVHELRAQAGDLWPLGPELVPALDAWLAAADELAARLALHEASLVGMRDAPGPARNALGGSHVSGGVEWVVRQQEQLVSELRRLLGGDAETSLLQEIRERRRVSANLFACTVEDRSDTWSQAIESIADEGRCPRYAGLRIEPQVGLIPLGPDPESGLWEFGLFEQTGPVPRRGVDGRLALQDDFGVVFVLVPGGTFLMGGQSEDPEGANFDPAARGHEGPPRRVQLAPYFLSKFEVTQAQWVAVEGSNPSYWAAGESTPEQPFGWRNPVEHVSRDAALAFARKIGCTLPSEAQWERAARAGASTTWATGNDPRALQGAANLLHSPTGSERVDPYRLHVPVGTFPPNAFGLHDMEGNLREWCLDVFKVELLRSTLPLHPETGVVRAEWDGDCSIRGASFSERIDVAACAHRSDSVAHNRNGQTGVRLARALRGAASPPRVVLGNVEETPK